MKRLTAILLVLVMVICILSGCGSSIREDWSTVLIGENIPTPQQGKLNSGSNLNNYFSGSIENVDMKYYSEYKSACIDAGYTIEKKEQGDNYSAFNSNGFKLSLYFYESSNEIGINLQAPEELKELSWPTTGIGAILPAPTSNFGKITSDSSSCFRVLIGDTNIDEYNDYVSICEQKGFTVDYIKQEGMFEAKNSEGYRLNLSYEGYNRIDIMIQTPKEANVDGNSSFIDEDTSLTTDEIDPDFKSAMDSYEEFMNEYVAFMKKYSENPSDLSLLADYADFMSDYADYIEDFEEWEDEDLNPAEFAYYLDVQTKVSQKLLEVSQ